MTKDWHINCTESIMKKDPKNPDIKLRNELVLAIVIKLLVLIAIWWFFFKEQRVSVDARAAWPETNAEFKHSKTGESL